MKEPGPDRPLSDARRTARWWIVATCLSLSVGRPVLGQAAQGGEAHWIGSWYNAPAARVEPAAPAAPATSVQGAPAPAVPPLPPGVLAVAPNQVLTVGGQSPLHFSNQTLRQIVHLTLGGSRMRVVLANTFGTVPLGIGAAQVALREKDATIVAGSGRILTFGGAARATVPPGAMLVSDPVDMEVRDFADLAIDLYLPEDTAALKSPVTLHAASWQTNYVSPPGNQVGAVSMPVQTTTAYRRGDRLVGASSFFLARVEVLAPRPAGVIVALGDSITDGTGSTIDTNNRWPDQLARRLAEAGLGMAVLNAGIGGNRLLLDGTGPGALARFDRDVLAQPGITHVIVLEGINDIGQARQNAVPGAADLIGAHQQLIARARARGIRIYAATLTPFEGASYWTPEGEAKRQALNDWIRTSRAYDAFFDFDAAVRDSDRPTKTAVQYDIGDHLHLNAAGYKAVAEAIDLALFRAN
jgi:lysophospholipase L1-like esterase